MAYIVNGPRTGVPGSSLRDRGAKAGPLALFSATAAGLVALIEMGHPFLATWGAMALLAALFVAGAGQLSQRSDD